MLETPEKPRTSKPGQNLSLALLFIAGLLLSLSSTHAVLYHWVSTTPGDGTSGSLTIPDADATFGFNSFLSPPEGSWKDPAGNVQTPRLGFLFGIFIESDGVLIEFRSNIWDAPPFSFPHSVSGGETTDVLGLLPGGGTATFNGMWVPNSTGVPEGGSMLLCLVAGIAALGKKLRTRI